MHILIPKNRTKTGTTTASRTPERNPGVVERSVAGQLHGAAEVRDQTPTETSSTVKGAAAEEVCDSYDYYYVFLKSISKILHIMDV